MVNFSHFLFPLFCHWQVTKDKEKGLIFILNVHKDKKAQHSAKNDKIH
jgi:hypothetical protein